MPELNANHTPREIRLRPVTASYSGETYAAIRRCLMDEALDVIAQVALFPRSLDAIDAGLFAELCEMRVLREDAGTAALATSVFLEDDIETIVAVVTPLAGELAGRLLSCDACAVFQNAPPELRIFLAGIVGLAQGLGKTMREKGAGVDWASTTGRYGRSKVDFDEICPAYDTLGPDVLNKWVHQGERFTAVFIGQEGPTFPAFLSPLRASDESRRYIDPLNRYLVDAFARYALGEEQSQSSSLGLAAEAAGIVRGGRLRSAVVTAAVMREYEGAVRAVAETASAYYALCLPTFDSLLRATRAGRQGVEPAAMALNLWRYVRKVTARELYARGFFTDSIREDGALAVFYENDVALIRELLF